MFPGLQSFFNPYLEYAALLVALKLYMLKTNLDVYGQMNMDSFLVFRIGFLTSS